MTIFMTTLLFILGGIFYRMRGSDVAWLSMLTKRAYGLFEGRLFWSALCASVMAAVNGDAVYLLLLPLFFLGVTPSYWRGRFNLEDQANRNWKNYAWLSLRGAFIALPVFLVTGQAWGGIIAGALFPAYYLTGLVLQRIKSPIPHLSGFSEWGEFLLGGSILVGIYLTCGGGWL
jgi:hypothetical protein